MFLCTGFGFYNDFGYIIQLWKTKYLIGEIRSSSRANLSKNLSDQTEIWNTMKGYKYNGKAFFCKRKTSVNHFLFSDMLQSTKKKVNKKI